MGKKGGSNDAAQARDDEQKRQAQIRAGTKSINTTFDSQFNPAYYAGRRQSFLDYASPQLEDQYGQASKQLTFALDRQGLLDSSVRADKTSQLQKLYDTNKRSVTDQALAQETTARTSVEDARANLIATLNATGDAQQAANSSIARATALSQQPAYSPLTNLFADFTNTLGVQAAQERAAAMSGGSYAPRYNTGLFGNSKSVAVTR